MRHSERVSFDVILQNFRDGEAAAGDGAEVSLILAPLIVDSDGNWARVSTEDGEAEVYGLDDPASGLMINHASGKAIWHVVFEVASRARFAVLPIGCPTCVPTAAMVHHLPRELADDALVIASGDELRRAIEAG